MIRYFFDLPLENESKYAQSICDIIRKAGFFADVDTYTNGNKIILIDADLPNEKLTKLLKGLEKLICVLDDLEE